MQRFLLAVSLITLGACEAILPTNTPGAEGISVAKADSIAMPAAALDNSKPLTRISFGSCLSEKEDQSIWTKLKAEKPDLFIFMGDNVYGDARKDDPLFNDPAMPKMRGSYAALASSKPFAAFREATPMMVAWDDHDYGLNDGGQDYVFKDQAKALFLEAWDIPADDPRRKRDGTYTSQIIGAEGQRVQVILLDTRSFRTALTPSDAFGTAGKERYIPSTDKSGTMLGEAQWAWLEAELEKPADLRIIVSSIQILADGHGWEAWRTMPHERDRFYAVLNKTNTQNAVILSGDRHVGAIYKREGKTKAPLYEVTASSLNLPASKWRLQNGETSIEDGPHRISNIQYEVNYGLMDIDWATQTVKLQVVSPGFETFSEEIEF